MILPLAGLLPALSDQSIFRFMLPPLPDLPTPSTPGAETPAPLAKTFELSQQYCSFCQRTVLHSVLEKVDSREQATPGAVSWLLQCKGCGAFSLQ
jgi:hypothetical protein